MDTKEITAAILIIGNEILSGRTLDKNTQTLAQKLVEKGIRLKEAQTIPDEEPLIAQRINDLRAKYSYVFTSGGIGPTHDDKTASALALAFNTELELNADAYQALLDYYGDENEINDGRRKMAYLPIGAELIPNAVSGAPGIKMDNVHVMAGVPSIFKSMLDAIIPNLQHGEIIHSENIFCENIPESEMAPILEEIENQYTKVEIGSYPRLENNIPSLNIVVRSEDINQLASAVSELRLVVDKKLAT